MHVNSCKISCLLICALGACITFALSAEARREVVLYSFCQSSGCPDGQNPYSPMVQDAKGNFFGTTLAGGNSSNAGTIYELQKVKRSWAFHLLYSFCAQANCTDGNTPYGDLIVDTSGNLYGTTQLGGNANDGIVYELQNNGTFKVLYSFCSQSRCADGAQPYAGLTYQGQQNGQLYDGSSTLYGTASASGGTNNEGVVYTILPGGAESVLYAFGANNNFNDGREPLAPLITDSNGNLYGTTTTGGSTDSGTIFSVSPTGSENILFTFRTQGGQNGGASPGTGALLMRLDGTLVGTTPAGGDFNAGVIYSFGAGTYMTLAHFCRTSPPCKSGGEAQSALIQDSSGNLYGVAPRGGNSISNNGTVFEFAGSKLKVIYTFCTQTNCTDGAEPYSRLIMSSRGALFGTTTQGGAFNGGTIFELP